MEDEGQYPLLNWLEEVKEYYQNDKLREMATYFQELLEDNPNIKEDIEFFICLNNLKFITSPKSKRRIRLSIPGRDHLAQLFLLDEHFGSLLWHIHLNSPIFIAYFLESALNGEISEMLKPRYDCYDKEDDDLAKDYNTTLLCLIEEIKKDIESELTLDHSTNDYILLDINITNTFEFVIQVGILEQRKEHESE